MKKFERDKLNLENYLLLGRGGYKYLTTLSCTIWLVFVHLTYWRGRCSEEKNSHLYYRCARLEVWYRTCGFYCMKWISFSSPVVYGSQNTRMWCIPYCKESTSGKHCRSISMNSQVTSGRLDTFYIILYNCIYNE
jgi:hypothetical protein